VIPNRERDLTVGKTPKPLRSVDFDFVLYTFCRMGLFQGQGGKAWEHLKLALVTEDKTMYGVTTS